MKKKKTIPHRVDAVVRPIIVHDLAISIYSLATASTRKESERKIIEYIKEIERERIKLFGK